MKIVITSRYQKNGKTFDQFFSDLKKLVALCEYSDQVKLKFNKKNCIRSNPYKDTKKFIEYI